MKFQLYLISVGQ